MGQVTWTLKASDNLESIYEYIAKDSIIYANRFIKSLIKATDVLITQPYIGRNVPESDDKIHREILYKDYRIVYRVMDNTDIEILIVAHGSKNMIIT